MLSGGTDRGEVERLRITLLKRPSVDSASRFPLGLGDLRPVTAYFPGKELATMKRRSGANQIIQTREGEARRKLLGPALRVLRQRGGKKQVTLAGETGLTKAMVSSYETGRQLPSLGSLLTVLAGLGCDFHDLQEAMDYLSGKPPRLKPAEVEEPKADAEREVGGAVITLVRHLGLHLPLGPRTIELPPARVEETRRAG
jgi:transcriptional regulator with XRE-family HTH domain